MDKTTLPRTFRLAALVGAALLLVSGVVAGWQWWQARQVPSRAPDLAGPVAQIETNTGRTRFLVRTGEAGGWWVVLKPETRVRYRNGRDGTVAPGQRVSVWHDGTVYETYPPIVYAEWVVVEEDEGPGP